VNNLIILCGGAEETNFEKQVLKLKCCDTYDGLSEKMMKAFDYILSSEQFSSFTHFLKADDHDTDFSAEQIEEIPIKYHDILVEKEYIGQKLIENCTAFRWHFGKVPITSKWHNLEYHPEKKSYLGGGETYILSRNALTLLVKHMDAYEEHGSYEDSMMGTLLSKYSIQPFQLMYGIKTWRG